MPLKKGDVSQYGIGAQPGQAIFLGLEWGGVSRGDRQRTMPERGGGRGGGGRGGGMGGGPPGGGRGGAGGDWVDRPGGGSRPQAAEKQELWVKTKLALPSTE